MFSKNLQERRFFVNKALRNSGIAVLMCLTLLFGARATFFNVTEEGASAMTDSGLCYEETTEEVLNPGQGFYLALGHSFGAGETAAVWSVSQLKEYARQYGLLHLRLGLKAFSAAAGGADIDLTEEMLASFAATLENVRQAGFTAMIRFSYNLSGNRDENGRYLEAEPPLALIERHIASLGTVIARYTDVIIGVETGMFGPWGEQHSTQIANSANAENYCRLVAAWLKAVPAPRPVSVRRPLYFTHWANLTYGLNLTPATLGAFRSEESGLPAAAVAELNRVGVYNDGYLGSSSDLGTFTDRTSETQWISRQTGTYYGGEVVADSKTGNIGEYNNVSYLEREGFLTHTSYLNYGWNYDKVIAAWEKNTYRGADPVYYGKTSEYRFVANRLGYRLVLRSLKVSGARGGDSLRVEGRIENVGFGQVVADKKAELVLSGGGETLSAEIDWDIRKVRGTVKAFSAEVSLPASLAAGDYRLYFKLSDREEKTAGALRTIRLANDDERIWNAELGANFLADIALTEGSGEATDFKQISAKDFSEAVEERYTVSFEAGGGEGAASEAVEVAAGDAVTLPDNPFSRTGFGFAGWSDGETVHAAGARVTVYGDTVFTAQWQKLSYTVTFDLAGGTLSYGTLVQTVGHGESAAPPVAVREGYEFCGWEGSYEGVTKDAACTAIWKKVAPDGTNNKKGCGGTEAAGTAGAAVAVAGAALFLRRRV